jgi:hypothetical protein
MNVVPIHFVKNQLAIVFAMLAMRETYSPVVQTRTNVVTVPTCADLMECVLITPARTAVNAIRDTAIRRLLADVWILMNV